MKIPVMHSVWKLAILYLLIPALSTDGAAQQRSTNDQRSAALLMRSLHQRRVYHRASLLLKLALNSKPEECLISIEPYELALRTPLRRPNARMRNSGFRD